MKDFKVRCVESADAYFTSGKTYEVKNGKLIDDGERERPYMNEDRFENVNQINNYSGFKSYEWIGKFELIPEPQQFTKADLKTGDILIGEERRYKIVKGSDRPDFAIDPNGWFFLLSSQPEKIEDLPTLKINKVIRPELMEDLFNYQPKLYSTVWQRPETMYYTISEAEAELTEAKGKPVKIRKE